MSSPPIALGSTVGGRYKLLDLLGSGAMGTVYRADRGTPEQVALKILSLEPTSGTMIARFVREARVASRIKHPNVLPVIDSGVDEATGHCFLVMPLVQGEDLGQLIERVGPLRPDVAVRLLIEAGEGLAMAHESGVIHRDIKPSNILLGYAKDTVTPMIGDFGIARDAEAERALTATGAVMGSPHYMAPEQFANAKGVDGRADVWSLGVTLYEMLAGRPPHGGLVSAVEVLLNVTTKPLPPLQDSAPWIPPELARVVHGALLRPLEDRCPDVRAFLEALAPFAADGSVEQRQLTPLPEAVRAEQAPRAALPQRWAEVAASRSSRGKRSSDSLLGRVVGGKFRLLRKLGEGGMGAVYEAQGPGGSVAIKVLSGDPASGNAEALRRFMREAKSTRSVDSPYVVRVIEAEQDGGEGVPYIAMELLSGLDLDTLVRRMGPLEPRATAAIFIQAARGLAAAHAAGIIHRDIKPANLFLHEDDEGLLTTKVCDFGVAKSGVAQDAADTTMDLTRTGGMLGSPMYMSPEQARNAKYVDHRTDIWSLCLSLYEALSGRKPWARSSTMGELILAICTEDIKPLQDLAPWVSPELAAIVHKGLQRDPADRWGHPEDLVAALASVAAPGPVSRQDLGALSAELRSREAPRMTSPLEATQTASAGAPLASAGVASPTAPSPGLSFAATEPGLPPLRAPRSPRTSLRSAAVVVAFVGLSFGGYAVTRGTSPASSVSLASSLPLPPSAEATAPIARKTVEVRVTPADASVRVRGAPGSLAEGGLLLLNGEIGETIEVQIEAAGVVRDTTIFITRDGLPSPSAVVLALPPANSVAPGPPSRPVAAGKPVANASRPKEAPKAEPPPKPPVRPVMQGDL